MKIIKISIRVFLALTILPITVLFLLIGVLEDDFRGYWDIFFKVESGETAKLFR